MTRQDGSSLDNSRQEQNECLESVIVEAAARKETKTLIWITAKDKSNEHSLFKLTNLFTIAETFANTFAFRFWISTQMCSENWQA